MAEIKTTNAVNTIEIVQKGFKGDRDATPYPHSIHVSGSEYSGSMLVAIGVTGSILPQGDGNWDLGSETHPFRDLYITTASLKFVSQTTGKVISSLSAKDVDDLKKGKTITTQSKTLTDKDGTTESKTSFVEGTAFISSLDNDVYIKTGTNRMSLIAGGSGVGNIDIGGPKQQTHLGPTNITGALTITGSLTVGTLLNSGTFAEIDFIASQSQAPIHSGSGTVTMFENQFHHLRNSVADFDPNNPLSFPELAKIFYIGNWIDSVFTGNDIPNVNFIISSSGKSYLGPLPTIGAAFPTLEATLTISGTSGSTGEGGWGALSINGSTTASGDILVRPINGIEGSIGGNISASGTGSFEYGIIRQDLTVLDDIKVGDNIIHYNDSNTKISFGNDTIQFDAGGDTLLTLSPNGPSYNLVILGEDCNDSILLRGDVTASCNISASGFITASNILVTENFSSETITVFNEADFSSSMTLGENCSHSIHVKGKLTASCVVSGGAFYGTKFVLDAEADDDQNRNEFSEGTIRITNPAFNSSDANVGAKLYQGSEGQFIIDSYNDVRLNLDAYNLTENQPNELFSIGEGVFHPLAGERYFTLITNGINGQGGSINDIHNISMSGDLTASGVISASADTQGSGSKVHYLGGSVILGDDCDDLIYVKGDQINACNTWLQGPLTASIISTSGTIYANEIISTILTSSFVTTSYTNLAITNDLTASGNISASGELQILGGDIFLGDTCANDINVLGTITSSCDISTSKIITAEHFFSSDDATITDTLTVGTIANVNTTHVTASGAISASGNIGNTLHHLGGSMTLGDTCTDNIIIKGTITSSCIISSSENIIGANITASGGISVEGGDIDLSGDVTLGATCADDINILGNVTASCNISASGTVYAGEFVLPSSGRIQFDSADTFIASNADTVEDLMIASDGDILMLPDNNINVGYSFGGGTEKLTVEGNISASSLISHTHITASGNISSSEGLYAKNIYLRNGLYHQTQMSNNFVWFNSGAASILNFTVDNNSPLVLYSNKTCVAVPEFYTENISASGHITASGAISASGNIGNTPHHLGGSMTLGDACTDDIIIKGTITSSCIISSSENIIGANITASGGISVEGGNIDLSGDVTLGSSCTDDINILGNVTASCNISASGTITGSNAQFGSITIEGGDGLLVAEVDNYQVMFGGIGGVVTGSNEFIQNYNQKSLFYSGSFTSSGIVSTEPIYAPAFVETGTGQPTIESDSNIVLSASNAVVIAKSPFRLSSFVNAQTASGEFTFVAGDMYFNSTTNNFMGYNGTAHVKLDTQ